MSTKRGGSHLSDTALRVRALESLLTEKGLVDPAALDAVVDAYENKIGPRNGAKVVARAWADCPGVGSNAGSLEVLTLWMDMVPETRWLARI